MPATLGQKTKTTFIKDFDGHDIFEEFEAGEAIKIGQPIKMGADGKAVPAAAGEVSDNVIGTSIHEREAGEYVTVATRFRCIIFGLSTAAETGGPVEYAGYEATEEYNQYVESSDATKTIGWNLDAVDGAGEMIRVGLL